MHLGLLPLLRKGRASVDRREHQRSHAMTVGVWLGNLVSGQPTSFGDGGRCACGTPPRAPTPFTMTPRRPPFHPRSSGSAIQAPYLRLDVPRGSPVADSSPADITNRLLFPRASSTLGAMPKLEVAAFAQN
jgi:hypothetical protein